MKKIFMTCIAAAAAAFMISSPAFAEGPAEESAKVMVEDDDDSGNDKINPKIIERNDEELQKMVDEIMKETNAVYAYGDASFSIAGELKSEKDVIVTLRGSNGVQTMILPAREGWNGSVSLPVGKYLMESAVTEDGKHKFYSDFTWFDVVEGSPIKLTLSEVTEDSEIVVYYPEEETEPDESKQPVQEKAGLILNIAVGMFAAIVIIAYVMIFLRVRKNKRS